MGVDNKLKTSAVETLQNEHTELLALDIFVNQYSFRLILAYIPHFTDKEYVKNLF